VYLPSACGRALTALEYWSRGRRSARANGDAL